MKKHIANLNYGKTPITICNEKNEEMGVIYIDATDFNILKRLDTAKENIAKIRIENKNITGDEIQKIDMQIREQIDYAFDSKISDTVFKNQHTLSTYNGETFVERFINSIEPVVNEILGEESKKVSDKMNQYTRPYTNDHNKKKKGKGNDRRITEARNNREKKVQNQISGQSMSRYINRF